MLRTKPLLSSSIFLFGMERTLIASMYIGDEVAWIDFHNAPLVLPFTHFDNNRPAADQSPTTLKEVLEELCLCFLEKEKGFLPSGKIFVEQDVDPKFDVRVYKAYYSDSVPV